MDATRRPTLRELTSLHEEESRVKEDLKRTLATYAERLPLVDRHGVNPRKPEMSEIINIFRAFSDRLCEICRRAGDNNPAEYAYKAVVRFCRTTPSEVAIRQLPDDPEFTKQIRAAIHASLEDQTAADAAGSAGVRPSPRAEQAKRRERRAAWLDKNIADRGWTSDTDVHANGGPAYNTIQRYRSGQKSTRDLYVRGRLANAFGCKVAKVPK